MILIDLQEAFDTTDQDALSQNPYVIAFSRPTIHKFHLTSGFFLVDLAKQSSQPASIFYGASQGLILGSLLFLVYVNDMLKAVKCHLFLSLDDSCLVCQHKDIDKIGKHLNLLFSRYVIDSWVIS